MSLSNSAVPLLFSLRAAWNITQGKTVLSPSTKQLSQSLWYGQFLLHCESVASASFVSTPRSYHSVLSCYQFLREFKVYRVVFRHQAQIHSQMQVMSANADHARMPFKHLRRSAMTIFYVYCLFLFCYLPYIVASLFAGKGFGKYYAVLSTLVFLNFSYIH